MVETIFDVADMIGGIWFWYFFFIVIIGVWANSKNRNAFAWAVAALFFSPLIVGIILLFTGKREEEEKKEFTCTKCKAKVSESDEFCPKCGVKFKEDGVRCLKCKTLNKESNKYCSKCGNKIMKESEYSCEYCDKRFKSEEALDKHYEYCQVKKERAEKDKKIVWAVGIIIFLGFGIYFLINNKINLIPLVLIGFISTVFFDKLFNWYKKKNKKLKHFEFHWWKKSILIGSIILLFVLINLIIPECPNSCDDNHKCTNDFCSAETGFKCMNTIKFNCKGNGICEAGEYGKSSDCPDCNDWDKCTADSYDTASKQCIHIEISGCIS